MGKGAKREKEESEAPKVPFKVWFPEWVHHKPTGPDDEDRYCGTRNGEKWRAILLFYFLFYGFMLCFWIINYQGMLAYIPDRVGGDGPLYTDLIKSGWTQVNQGSGDYSVIAADNGAYTLVGSDNAYGTFRDLLDQSDYDSLQTQISTDVAGNPVGSQFFYNNCTTGPSCTSPTFPYGNFGPMFLLTYRNRAWDKPDGGASGCAIACTFIAKFVGSADVTGTVSATHFWKLDMSTGTWTNNQAFLDCTPFRNQPNYRAFTAVSAEGLAGKTPSSYQLTCTIDNIGDESTTSNTLTFVA